MELESCRLCPRNCNAKRESTWGRGFCKMGMNPSVARAALHFWEEPCISGTKGSGTVFFTGCTLQCVFCQNAQISTAEFPGKYLTPQALSEVFWNLVEQGAHNINLVNPTHFVPAIVQALEGKRLPIPVVYNSSGYEAVDTLKQLEGLVDIYLPDFKYGNNEIALRYSKAPDYVDYTVKAITEMVRQCGRPKFNEAGLMQSGVMVRHLILPGNTKSSIEVLDRLSRQFGKSIYVSLMAQYLPCGKVDDTHYVELNRRITKRELEKIEAYLFQLDLEGFVQERESAQKLYIPNFDFQGVE